MATAGGKKKTKFEYKPDIYNDNRFTEQNFQDAIALKESPDLIVREFDLRPFASELYQSHLPQFFQLANLVLENCNLDSFYPKGLGVLKKLSLNGNQITNLNSFVLIPNKLVVNTENTMFGRLMIPEVTLLYLDLSDN